MRGWKDASATLYLLVTTGSVQSHLNFSCKLWMIEGGTLLILGHEVKG